MVNKDLINVIVIAGPTASGKTDIALHLADFAAIEIISADSRQIFKYMDIGTAKPSKEELDNVKHHFIDILEPDVHYSAGMFGDDAEKAARNIAESNKTPVVVGGSGLYIQSMTEGLFEESIKSDPQLRDELNRIYQEKGRDKLYEMLLEKDPGSAENNPDKNPVRMIRALEYAITTGKKISEERQNKISRNINPIYFAAEHNRDTLYDRINRRTEIMWEMGFELETKKILEMGFSPELNSLNTVGYKECIDYLRGNINRQTAIDKMKQNTRRFAKRQLTWFRKINGLQWLEGDSKSIAEKIAKICNL